MKAIAVASLAPIFGCDRTPLESSNSSDEIAEMPEPIDLPIALLRRLHEIGDLIESKFPAEYERGMGQLGLLLSSKRRNGGYWCSPENSLSFGGTGGDGVHFSLVQVNGAVTEESPVVMTVPANFGEPRDANAIVGSSLISFLRFGLLRGYFAMAQLVYQRDLTLKAYSSAEWQPTEQAHYSVGFGVDESKKRVMQLVAEELKVTPLSYTSQEFEALQQQYIPSLKFKPS
ncbi:MAG: hypothetical protein NT069_20345 [Planctomycetota bacterium]|nr:hypothetical protein [Planctomycetota bacterium]